VRPHVATSFAVGEAVRKAIGAFGESVEELAVADALLINSGVSIDEAYLDRAPRVRAIASASVGYDNVDVEALARRGIAFANSRGSLTDAVADLTFALVVMALRRLPQSIDWVRSGRWGRGEDFPFAHDVAAKTLGIVGMGEIGAALAARARVAKMRIVYANRQRRNDDEALGASYRRFEDLLAESDVVVALVPLTAETHRLFDAGAFARMRRGAYFVNAARGAIVDTDALVAALGSGRLAGAALDVTDPDPLPADHPLLAHPDVVVTPHIGSATVETRERMSLVAVENLRAYFAGEPMPTAVALPRLTR
jgi:glyoxylate reductase